MAIGERFRSGGARGIARFLSDHQHCDAGFDVHREAGAGTGRLKVTCKGCGASIAYKAAEAGELAAGPALANGEGPVPEPSMDPPPGHTELSGGFTPSSPAGGERPPGHLPRWVAPLAIGLLIAAGVAMIVIGLNRTGGTGTTPETTPEEAPTATSTAASQAQPAPAATQQAPPPTQPQVALNDRSFEGRFTIGVPPGWSAGERNSAISLASGGRVAEIRVYFQPSDEGSRDLARGAASFLEQEHPGAEVTKLRTVRLGPRKGMGVTATYQGGEESAVVLSGGGYEFLVLRRVDDGASPDVAAQADASLQSFKPKA